MDFLERYSEYASEITDAPENFHTAVGLSILSAAVSSNCYLQQGDQKIFPNLWIVILGGSSFSRKTTAITIGRNLLHDFLESLILPDEFSPEALTTNLASNPKGIFIWSEFSAFLSLLSKDYMAGTKQMLTNLFDYIRCYKRKLRNETFYINEPCIGILAGSTVEWFSNSFQEGDLQGGFLVRFLFMPEMGKRKFYPIPGEANTKKRNALLLYLREIAAIKGKFDFSDVQKQYTDFYQELVDMGRDPQYAKYSSFLSRLDTYCKKFAMLYALSSSRTLLIRAEHLQRAIKRANLFKWYFINLCEEEFAFTKWEKQMKKLRRDIPKFPEKISRSQLLKRSRLPQREFSSLLSTMIETDDIGVIFTRTPGRPLTEYFIKNESFMETQRNAEESSNLDRLAEEEEDS